MERISSRQLTWLLISLSLSTPTFLMPSATIFYCKQNAFIPIGLAVAVVAAGLWLDTSLAKKFPTQTIAQYAQTILGIRLGQAVGIFYALMCLFTSAFSIRSFAQLFETAILPETPLWALVVGITIVCVYAAWQGVEPIARISDLILPFALVAVTITLVFDLGAGKLYYTLPNFQSSLSDVLKGSVLPFGYLSELSIILVLAPAINKPAQLRQAVFKGLMLVGVSFIVITYTILYILGPYRASANLFPLLNIAQELIILDVFERPEPLLLSAWLTLIIIKGAVFLYCASLSASQVFGRNAYRPIVISGLLTLPFLALLPKSLDEQGRSYVGYSFEYLAPLVLIVFPGLLLLVAKVRGTR